MVQIVKKLIWPLKASASEKKNLYIRRVTATVAGLIYFGAAVSSTQAATITVTTTSDVVDGIVTSITNLVANPGADTKISLREAVSAVNNTSGSDTILFDSSINGTPIIIDITGTGEDLNVDGDLDITDANGLTITGNGQSNTIIDGDDNERVLDVLFGELSITALTIRNGDETVNSAPGGGVRAGSDAGNLTVTQSTVADNAASFGGGIFSRASGSTVTLTNSTFTGNEGYSGSGGAFRVSSSNIQLSVDHHYR